jgi:hypothetical protein
MSQPGLRSSPVAEFSTLASTLHAVQAERDALAARLSAAEQEREEWCASAQKQFLAARHAEARAEAAERAITAAFRELQRISDVRASRTKVIGKAALILAAALAGREET